ncbi:hypothetical protein ACFU0W_12295 [Microbacterium keratanolyticum]|uniref:hypothetical protein n=1 Tax=Microbacterium keratanolyticum TaxID=67574 RepID=UPI003639AB12
MRIARPLPASLGPHFSTGDAARVGVGRTRRDGDDLARPFRGARAVRTPSTFAESVGAYRPLLRPGQRFGGKTALRLWGLPCPGWWSPAEPLEIAVPPDAAPPRRPGVRGYRVAPTDDSESVLDGVPLLDPVAALFTAAHGLTVTQTIVLIDAILATSSAYRGRSRRHPLVFRDDIESRLRQRGRFPGCGTVRAALKDARAGVESPKETETRLLIIRHGMPEPVVQYIVRDRGRFLARVDLGYPQWRIAVEYEGDGHRTDREQWRRDIQRQRDLEDGGWTVIRLTEADLHEPAAFLRRLRRAIAAAL